MAVHLSVYSHLQNCEKGCNDSMAVAWLTNFFAIDAIWPGYLPPKGREEVLGSHEFIADVFAPLGCLGEGWRWIPPLWGMEVCQRCFME